MNIKSGGCKIWTKRLLCFLLTAVMLAGLLPVPGNLGEARADGLVPKPDIELKSITAADTTETGLPLSVTASVYNDGAAGMQSVSVELAVYDSQEVVVYSAPEQTVELSAGETEEVLFGWTPYSPGIYTLKAYADGKNLIDESEESNNEKICTVTVTGDSVPLTLVGESPKSGSRISDLSGMAFSLTFNKPVMVVQGINSILYCNKNNSPTLNNSLGSNQSVYSGSLLTVDPANPCKVNVNIDGCLDTNRLYALKIGAGAIKSADGTETSRDFTSAYLDGSDGLPRPWQFDTGLVPKAITAVIPANIDKGTPFRLSASATDSNGSTISGIPLVWNLTSNPQNIASLTDNGDGTASITGSGVGSVQVKVQVKTGNYYSNLSSSGTINIREKYDWTLASVWYYNIPIQNSASTGTYDFPVNTSDGSVYYKMQYPGLQESTPRLYALEPSDGSAGVRPKTGFANPAVTVQPTAAEIGGEEMILTGQGNMFLALDKDTGTVLWQRQLPSDMATPASVTPDGTVIVGCSNGNVYALKQENDGICWTLQSEGKALLNSGGSKGFAAFTVDNSGTAYVVAADTLRAVDGATGRLLWKFSTPDTRPLQCQAAVGEDGTVFIFSKATSANSSKIYALTPPTQGSSPEIKWQVGYLNNVWTLGQKPLIDGEGNVYFYLRETSSSDYMYAALKGSDGSFADGRKYLKAMPSWAVQSPDGTIYTNDIIIDSQGNPVAYYKDYYGNLSYFSYSNFTLSRDGGLLYRFWCSGSRTLGVEAARLYNKSESSGPVGIKLDRASLTLYNGQSERVYGWVLDANGVVLTAEQLVWKSSDTGIVTVSDGLLTASSNNTGTATVAVSVAGHPEITPAVILVEVKNIPVPVGMYLIEEKSGFMNLRNDAEAGGYRVDEISGHVGEALPSVCAFVYDQYGGLVQQQPITWTLGDSGLADMLNYQGLSGSDVRYDASLTGRRAGSTTLKAQLGNYPDISCTIRVEVLPADWSTLWSVPLDGVYWAKWAWHAMDSSRIFYINSNTLRALDKKSGKQLWEADVGSLYGISLGKPVVGKDGSVYVYSTSNTTVVAVDPASGTVKWRFSGGTDGIKTLQAGADSVYALSEKGRLYRIGLDGKALWDTPLDLGSAIGSWMPEKGLLYASDGKALYGVGADRQKTALYTAQEGESVELKSTTPAGEAVVQKLKDGKYGLACLKPDGSTSWSRPDIQGDVKVSCGSDGRVYAYVPPKDDKDGWSYFYVFDADGSLKSSGVLDGGGIGGSLQKPYFKDVDYTPVPGKNGTVYFTGYFIWAVDGSTGKVQRTVQVKDGYSLLPPMSLTLDGDGVLYGTCGEMGLMAIVEKAYYGDGIQLSPGSGSLKAGKLTELRFKVRNTLDGDKRVTVSVSTGLQDAPAITATELLLKAGGEREVSVGIRLPSSGADRVVVTAADGDTGSEYARFEQALSGE
ncbi:MAG: PQQ-binding-like beta-propeller repeat protein [Clostridiales bacterium]|nr:PQQ-binding-like beta-propeller repeat protein [Eubacteriales bacterium]MDH7566229.1 PQQ-binding-like beta-propeller repeat protein [Clostridiales bacterium]